MNQYPGSIALFIGVLLPVVGWLISVSLPFLGIIVVVPWLSWPSYIAFSIGLLVGAFFGAVAAYEY